MTTKWDIDEKEELFKLLPSYFAHMEKHCKVRIEIRYLLSCQYSLLAKLYGFYTVKILEIASKAQKEVSFLVMENLFFNFDVSAVFNIVKYTLNDL